MAWSQRPSRRPSAAPCWDDSPTWQRSCNRPWHRDKNHLPGYGKASSTTNQIYSEFLMGFYNDLMGYEWDVATGNY